MTAGRDPQRERRKLFRRMECVFVYAPPLLALFIAGLGAVLLAAVVPFPGTTFWGRWAFAVFFTLVLPTTVYIIRARLHK